MEFAPSADGSSVRDGRIMVDCRRVTEWPSGTGHDLLSSPLHSSKLSAHCRKGNRLLLSLKWRKHHRRKKPRMRLCRYKLDSVLQIFSGVTFHPAPRALLGAAFL